MAKENNVNSDVLQGQSKDIRISSMEVRESQFDRKDLLGDRLAYNDSGKMRVLLLKSMANTNVKGQFREYPNPLWMKFPHRCQKDVTSEDHMRQLLKYHTTSADALIIKYGKENCIACNAMDKIMEFICHDAAKNYPNTNFYNIQSDKLPTLTEGMVKFPQVKSFGGGIWSDLNFRPSQNFREKMYEEISEEVTRLNRDGQAITAVQAEEMYFSAVAPIMTDVLKESFTKFYIRNRIRMHNYWKQVSVRRSWFYKKYIKPHANTQETGEISEFNEKVI